MAYKKTEVDIILPNYNSSEYIDKTIKSVINQSFKNWRLLIVDDFSDLPTKKIIEKYKKHKKIKIFWLKKNRGTAYCRNLALKKSKSKFIAFLDSDDTWEKNKLKNQIKFMEEKNYDFTYTNYKTIGLKNKNIETPKKFSFKTFTKNTSIATSTMIITRKIAKNVIFTRTVICEDYFFKCKILKKINYAYGLNEYLTSYRLRDNSMQSNKLRNLYWIWKINNEYNKFNLFQNLVSVTLISLNSIKKYGYR